MNLTPLVARQHRVLVLLATALLSILFHRVSKRPAEIIPFDVPIKRFTRFTFHPWLLREDLTRSATFTAILRLVNLAEWRRRRRSRGDFAKRVSTLLVKISRMRASCPTRSIPDYERERGENSERGSRRILLRVGNDIRNAREQM